MQFFDGYEQFRTGDNPGTYMRMAGYEASGVIGAGGGRQGNSTALYCLNSWFSRDWTWSGNTVSFGVAVMQTGRGALFSLAVGEDYITCYTDPVSGLVTLRWKPVNPGAPSDTEATVGYVTPIPGRWYYYEATIDRAAKTLTVFVNGKQDVSFTIPTPIIDAPTFSIIMNPWHHMPWPVMPEGQKYTETTRVFDDSYVQDGGRIGAIQISGRLPSSDIQRQWGVSSADPTSAHYVMVGTLPPDTTNRFIYTGENNKTDLFKSSGTLPDTGAIISQGIVALVRKATADPVSIIAKVDGQAVTFSNIGRSWEYRYAVMSASGYDKTAIEAATFGVTSQL